MRELGNEEPGWYHLRTEGAALLVDIHDSAVPTADTVDPQQARWAQEALGLPEPLIFPSQDSEYFGFGPVLTEVGNDAPNWTTFRGELPVVAGGKLFAEDDFGDLSDTLGYLIRCDYEKAYPFAVTLNFLFKQLKKGEQSSDSPVPQHLHIGMTNREEGPYASAIDADVLTPLARWIHTNVDTEPGNEIAKAMMTAFEHMRGQREPYQEWDFRVDFRSPKWVNLTVPGNACGLDPDRESDESDIAYRLTPHNTDTPVEQLTLLFGLAKLEELAIADYRRVLAQRLAEDLSKID